MDPVRTGRKIIYILPYALVVTGILAAGKVAGSPGGLHVAVEALLVAAGGGLWAFLRSRRARQQSSGTASRE